MLCWCHRGGLNVLLADFFDDLETLIWSSWWVLVMYVEEIWYWMMIYVLLV